MSSGFVHLACPHCQKTNEVIPGTIVVECDHCGRLFRPEEGKVTDGSTGVSGASEPASDISITPPWEMPDKPHPVALSTDMPDPFAREDERETPRRKKRKRQDPEPEPEPVVTSRQSGFREGMDLKQVPEQRTVHPDVKTPVSSFAPAISIFVTLLVLAGVSWFLFSQQEPVETRDAQVQEAAPKPAEHPDRPTPEAGGQDSRTSRNTRRDAARTPERIRLDAELKLGRDRVTQKGINLTDEQLKRVRQVITHRESRPFVRWGAPNPELEVVVFIPFTYMGVARLRQMKQYFDRIIQHEQRIAVWIVYIWGTSEVEAEAADISHGLHWLHRVEDLNRFVLSLHKDTSWRVHRGPDGKINQTLRELGHDPMKFREKLAELPMQEIRTEVDDLLRELDMKGNDFSFIIHGRAYLEGTVLYNIHQIVGYELSLLGN